MGFWFTIIYQPISNITFFAMDVLNTTNFAIGIIALVIVVKLFLLHPSIKTAQMQIKLRAISDELKVLKEKKGDKKKIAEETLALYKRESINPFSPIFLILLQIPIFLGIFFFVRDVGKGDLFIPEVLYSFVGFEGAIDLQFLSFSLSDSGNILMGALLLATQYYVIVLTQHGNQIDPRFESFQKQLKIFLPILIAVASFFMVAAVGLYWLVNNLLSILQETLVTKRIRKGAHLTKSDTQPTS